MRTKHPCQKATAGMRHYRQKTIDMIKSEFEEHGIEVHQTFIDFEQEHGGYLIRGKSCNWYLRLDPFEHFIEDGILLVEFAVPCVAQPYFYFLSQNGEIYAAMNQESWQIAASLSEFLEEYV